MIRQVFLAAVLAGSLLGLAAMPAAAQERPVDTTKVPVVRLAPQAARAHASALAHSLLPDGLEQVEGNAALLWFRAGLAAREARFKWTDKQWNWLGPKGTPLNKLPVKEVQEMLGKHAAALYLCDQAARRTRCDWGSLPLTIQNLHAGGLPTAEFQSMRELANLLILRCRLALAQGKFDEDRRSLVTGLTLARHISEGKMVLHELVGIAIATIMLGGVEEWMQMPGSPNLYWALTELPRPLIGVRRGIRHELDTLDRSFPQLRRFKQNKLSAEEARSLVDRVIDAFTPLSDAKEVPRGGRKRFTKQTALAHYEAARKALLAAGRPAREVEAMPRLQVVVLYYLQEYDRFRDDVNRWLAVPSWQGFEPLMKVEQVYRAKAKKDDNVLISLLMPALVKVYQAQMRLERHLAGLRGGEALRQYAAANNGQAPAKWSALTTVPGPIDPFTGKGFDAFYKVEAGKAILTIPPPPTLPLPLLGRRYELAIKER
jgi:hypothetical protein